MPPLHLLPEEVVIRTRLAFLVLSCLAVSTGAAADDSVMINQAVNAAVAGGRNISTINQAGGSNNFAETDQLGSQNSATISQLLGSRNSATISQLGNGNQSTIIQDNAVGAIAVDNQIGNNDPITIRQTGTNPPPVTITQRR